MTAVTLWRCRPPHPYPDGRLRAGSPQGAPAAKAPGTRWVARFSGTAQWTRVHQPGEPDMAIAVCDQALGLLVPVSCTDYSASTSGLSTPWSRGGPYQVNPVGDLILKRASRLDAFSGYPCRT